MRPITIITAKKINRMWYPAFPYVSRTFPASSGQKITTPFRPARSLAFLLSALKMARVTASSTALVTPLVASITLPGYTRTFLPSLMTSATSFNFSISSSGFPRNTAKFAFFPAFMVPTRSSIIRISALYLVA